LFAEVSK